MTSDSDFPSDAVDFSPRDFLKQRKPEAFSDSSVDSESKLTRPFLEYFLNSLTSRSEEIAFENFARKLAQREVCPNLLPHTGPTGGGDSKVDTETYPVAETLALTWFYGFGAQHARWAFAISTKEKWRSKLQADLKKIVGTKRGYTDAYFISSRFVKDKLHGDLEDELSDKYLLKVHILDRNWVLDKVFERHRHDDLLVSEFGLQEAASPTIRAGALDRERQEDLNELEERISAAAGEGSLGPAVVDDCLRSVFLSRAMELPRTEVDGRLVRAARMAEQCGTSYQKMMAAYESAWTSFWYFNDSEPLVAAYDAVESAALTTGNSTDLELVSNLWMLLRTAVSRGWVDAVRAALGRRTATLRGALDKLAADKTRPSGALHALTMSLQLQLVGAKNDAGPLLDQIRNVLLEGEGLLGYPLMKVIGHMIDFGEVLGDVPEYDDLYASMAEIKGRREGVTAAALMLLDRGEIHIQAKRHFDAIRVLGRILTDLYTDETRDEAAIAFLLCGYAFEGAGLLWAARMTTLQAAHIASMDYFDRREITFLQAAAYNRMKWIELQLGRFASLLQWHEADVLFRSILEQQNEQTPEVRSDAIFDRICAVLLLKTPTHQCARLAQLPDCLEPLGLFVSASAIRYMLGHDPEIPNVSFEDTEAIFKRLAEQTVAGQLPPTVGLDRCGTVQGSVLGVTFEARTDGSAPAAYMAEAVIAGVESFMATARDTEAFGDGPRVLIDVRYDAAADDILTYSVYEEHGLPRVHVVSRVDTDAGLPANQQLELQKSFGDLLVEVCSQSFHYRNAEETFTRFIRDENALGRTSIAALSFISERNILGNEPKDSVERWGSPETRTFEVRRPYSPLSELSMSARVPMQSTNGDADRDESFGSHKDVKNVSLIRNTLWKRAQWCATAFMVPADLAVSPTLVFVFQDGEAGVAILRAWINEFGATDAEERLRITIVRGIDRERPCAYHVLVGTNLLAAEQHPSMRTVTTTRARRMEPDTDQNLRGFLARYERLGEYNLIAAGASPEGLMPFFDARLKKRQLNVREAWQIGRNDTDAPAIHSEDAVVVPSGITNPPVVALQEWLKQLAQ
jgi:hypothetical protein